MDMMWFLRIRYKQRLRRHLDSVNLTKIYKLCEKNMDNGVKS